MRKLAVGLTVLLLVLTHHALAQTPLADGWYFDEQTDPFADAGYTVIGKFADVSPQYSEGALFIRCDDRYEVGDIEVYFDLDDYIGSDDRYRVMHRFDDQEPVTTFWGASTDGAALFLLDRHETAFIRALRTSSQFAFRSWDYRDSPLTYLVDTTGAAEALGELHCELP